MNDVCELEKLDRILELEEQIAYHNLKYWEEEPEISDEGYDLLVSELKILAPDSPVFTKLEEQVSKESQNKYVHSESMLSLEKFYSKKEVIDWMIKMGRSLSELYKFMLKLDGISGKREDGNLATRGDGRVGENHTDKIPYINFVISPEKSLDDTICGEIIITDKFFEDNLKGEFKNSRNAVAGLMGRKHPEEIKDKGVTFIDYDGDDIGFVGNVDAIEAGWDDMIKSLTSKGLPYDGIVVKLADTDYYKQLGNKTKSPKGAIAYKFANKSAITKVNSITWQVSRNGKLTPVAELEPIELAGVTISRATCHNVSFIEEHVLRTYSRVVIERAGDVIPKIVRNLDKDKIFDNACDATSPIPRFCPCCDSEVKPSYNNDVLMDVFCSNEDCPDRIIENIVFMAKTIGIDSLNHGSARKLYDLFSNK